MQHRITMATVCLHLSAVLYAIIAIGIVPFFAMLSDLDKQSGNPPPPELAEMMSVMGIFMAVLCVALIIGIEFVAAGLRKRRFWAWVAGLCIFGLYLPSIFFPLGALGMWGLLDEGSRAEFRKAGCGI